LKAKQEQQADYDSKIAEQERSFQRLLGIVIIGGAFHIMLALLLWVNFTRDTAYNFRILMDNTRRLAKGLPLNPPIEGAGEIAHLDRVFKDMAQALKETERMKQELVAMVSHDLRTPLTSIQGFLTLLSTGMYGELTQPGSENLSIAESNITRLISLINDLLDIEKMQSGKLEMELREVPLQDVFDRSYGSVIGFAEQQKVKLAMEPCDLLVYADGDRLVQVLVNLMSNAIKFSPKDAEVRVRAEERDDSVEIRVVDHGRGVPAAYREAIFERFQQVQKSDAKVKGGSGLGLAICKAIIEGHHGFIGVESEEGKGSTFWFRVPKPAAAQQAALVTTSTVDTTQ
jgi:signal transduction histidine kinase